MRSALDWKIFVSDFRGKLFSQEWQGRADSWETQLTFKAKGAKEVSVSRPCTKGRVEADNLMLMPKGTLRFDFFGWIGLAEDPFGEGVYKLKTPGIMEFRADQTPKSVTVQAASKAEAAAKAGLRTADADFVDIDDLGDGRWKVTSGSDVFDLRQI